MLESPDHLIWKFSCKIKFFEKLEMANVSETGLQMKIRFSLPDHFELYIWLAELIRVIGIVNQI